MKTTIITIALAFITLNSHAGNEPGGFNCQFQKRLFSTTGVGVVEEEKKEEYLAIKQGETVEATLNGFHMRVFSCDNTPDGEIDLFIENKETRMMNSSMTHANQPYFGTSYEFMLPTNQLLELSVYCAKTK